MKSKCFFFLAIMLPMMAIISMSSCSKDDGSENNNVNGTIDGGKDNQQEIVVTVDANGNASDGHSFTRIDDTNFYIDELKYAVAEGNLIVSGYDPVFFTGVAKIISKLIYNGRTFNVVGIADEAFKDCVNLTSVGIPKRISTIGFKAFSGCNSLTSVRISDLAAWCSISFMGKESNPLYFAPHLIIDGKEASEIIIPDTVTSIGQYAFVGYTSMTTINIPNSVTSIGQSAFQGCNGLISIIVPKSLERINQYTFSDCYSLTSITIPEKVKSIGRYAFENCVSLESVIIGNNVESIEGGAFSGCGNLSSVSMGNSISSIEFSAFEGCCKLTSITIPSTVLRIGEKAFSGCSGLTSVRLESDAIVSVNRISEITYDSSFKSVFGEQVKEYVIGDEVHSIGNNAFYGCTKMTSVTIGSNVNTIGNYSFVSCSSLSSITIPSSVTKIGERAFVFCYLTKDLFINNSVLTNSSNWGITLCEEETNDGLLITNGTLVRCRPWASSITIPNKVTIIGDRAFSDCTSLSSVNIPNSVTSIEHSAFFKCNNITSITIGSGVKTIGSDIFMYCNSLKDVYSYSEEVPKTDSEAFYYSPVSTATLHVPATSIQTYKTTTPWNKFGTIIAL